MLDCIYDWCIGYAKRKADEDDRKKLLEILESIGKSSDALKIVDMHGMFVFIENVAKGQAITCTKNINAIKSACSKGYELTDAYISEHNKMEKFDEIKSAAISSRGVRNDISHLSQLTFLEYSDAIKLTGEWANFFNLIGHTNEADMIRVAMSELADPSYNEHYDGMVVDGQEMYESGQEDIRSALCDGAVHEVEINKFVMEGTKTINIDLFSETVSRISKGRRFDEGQYSVISSAYNQNLRIIAGPGSGKTSVIVHHILKAILVDGLDPTEVVATTFTKKAANEIRSRIISVGESLRKDLLNNSDVLLEEKNRIRGLDFNGVILGTLDSISEDLVRRYGSSDSKLMSVAEQDVIGSIFKSLYDEKSTDKDAIMNEYIRTFKSTPKNESNILEFCQKVYERMMQNVKTVDSLSIPATGELLKRYIQRMQNYMMVDFAMLERELLSLLESDSSSVFTDGLKLLVVDEYQDTNLLQECIYFSLGKKILANGGGMKVVGDDDQTIYGFRGSHSELFVNLVERAEVEGIHFATRSLGVNYRSTGEIVDFCNRFIKFDRRYSDFRAKTEDIRASRAGVAGVPVFSIFSDDNEYIADCISRIVSKISSGHGFTIKAKDGTSYHVGDSMDVSDITYLSSSTLEYLRKMPTLSNNIHTNIVERGIPVSNPRGIYASSNTYLGTICGLLIRCLDPDKSVLAGLTRTPDVSMIIEHWMTMSDNLLNSPGREEARLYVKAWSDHRAYPGKDWDDSVPLLNVIYDIVQVMGQMPDGTNDMGYFRLLLDKVKQSVQMNRREQRIRFENGRMPRADSVEEIYAKILIPLTDDVRLDEDHVVPGVDFGSLRMMSIHQSKGLEFPITIVNVDDKKGPKYAGESRTEYRTKNKDQLIEIMLYGGTDIYNTKASDLAFNDAIRKYYVAFSRAKDVLILVGPSNPDSRALGVGSDKDCRIVPVEAIL